MALDIADLPQHLGKLQQYRALLSGDEKGESQVFLDRLFQAFGHEGYAEAGAKLEMRLKKNDNKGTSFADLVWKPRVLIEMKKAGADLSKHFRQAFDYWVRAVPDRPRYVVLCNFDEFWIYDFDRQVDEPVDRVALADLPRRWEAFGFMLADERPAEFANDLVEVTRESADKLAKLFNTLVARGVGREQAQRFLLQSVMAMFAEDIRLLPTHHFTTAVTDSLGASKPVDTSYDVVFGLFTAMNTSGATPGGRYAGTPYFNGGLYSKVEPFGLERAELEVLADACRTDWSLVRPEIFGTLFEQSLGKEERHAYGAYFTSPADIAKIVGPSLVEPWRARIEAATTLPELRALHHELSTLRVLDPACGCGNFLYVAYRELRRLEHEVLDRIEERSRRAGYRELSLVTPEQFHGIDVRPFAVEVAKVTLMVAKKFAADELGDDQHVLPLENLDANIIEADALFTAWPSADLIIGNPPYLGRRKVVEERGAAYADQLAQRYPAVSGVSDYVSYWFPLAHDQLPQGGRAGLVATNTIRQGDTRKVTLDYVVDHGGTLTEAVSTQPWSGDAVVHVSIVNWVKGEHPEPKVLWVEDGRTRLELPELTTSLSPTVNVRSAKALTTNKSPKRVFQGQTFGVVKAFKLSTQDAAPLKRASAGDASVIHPFIGGEGLLHENPLTQVVIDVPDGDADTAWHRAPAVMARLQDMALTIRQEAAEKEARRNGEALAANANARVNHHHKRFLETWWRLSYRREDLLGELAKVDRYIAVTRTATHARLSVFTFVEPQVHPGDSVVAFPLDDDYSLGILQSSTHKRWFDARCTTLKVDPNYTSTTVWDSFAWPQHPTPAAVKAVSEASAALTRYRQESMAQGRTLAQMYDVLRTPGKSRLRTLHEALDAVVTTAYEFDPKVDVLAQLLSLNLTTADQEAAGEAVTAPGLPRHTDGTPYEGCRLTDWALSAEWP
ncbi:class I SAM-dependent DNA methyltransferase [Quadrisphaera sp. INWT6]|uniref:class I SAM-dependent DNA methyltransferase n=1 Tax=Quadrisphaera sp. INWT6 TaxID=2596917 RepID=UPI0018921BC2|nr:class I SAM-dependent DNA methyltransferase [Quadrisphaera sp. INWT6]